MDQPFVLKDQRLAAVIKTAQYLAGLTSDRDIWRELGMVVTRFFGADIVAFASQRPGGETVVHSCISAEEGLCPRLIEAAGEIIGQVLESGFLASELLSLPQAHATAILPLTEGRHTAAAMLVGHRSGEPLSRELLDLYLAVAGLFDTALARIASERERKHSLEQLEASLEETIQAMAATIEMRDPYTAGHQRRVADLARRIAEEMGRPEEETHGIYLAAAIHDIGKIHIPAEILSFPGKLGEIEYTLIKAHAQAGYEILKNVEFPWPVAQMVWQHHEHLDGSGYPRGLQGDDIMLGARILCVADVVESMASFRPYRPGLGTRKALAEIRKHRGRLYDAAVVDACLKLFREKGYEFDFNR